MNAKHIEEAIDKFTENIGFQDYSTNNKIYFGFVANDRYQLCPIAAKELSEYIYAQLKLTNEEI